VEEKNLMGEKPITTEHVQNNQTVRQMLGTRGIKPEELPASEDIKKLERRISNNEKMIEKRVKKLPAQK
jgi:DNA-damage-inducible protein D